MNRPAHSSLPPLPHATTEIYEEPVVDAIPADRPAIRQGLFKRLLRRFSLLGLIGLVIVVFWIAVALALCAFDFAIA